MSVDQPLCPLDVTYTVYIYIYKKVNLTTIVKETEPE